MFAGYEGIEYFVDIKEDDALKIPHSVFANSFPCLDDETNFFNSKDYLILIEGSELDGPIHKFIIPDNSILDFNIDEFSVSIMSIDMQNVTGILSFNLNSDAQVFQTVSAKGFYAFVNYFTLYDIMARGFIRPFCFVYLTKEYNKLIDQYEEFSLQLNNLTRELKIKNIKLFHHDLTCCLSDFNYTRTSYFMYMGGNRDFNAHEVNIFKNISNISEIEFLINEIVSLLQPLTILINAENLNCENSIIYEPKLKTIIRNKHQKSLRSIEELCNISNFYDYLLTTYTHFNKYILNDDQQIGDLYIGREVILNFSKTDRFQYNSISMECQRTYNSSIGKNILQFIRRYSFSVNLFYSLLIGQPTFVIGSDKLSLQNALDTISLFVPGYFTSIKIFNDISELTNISNSLSGILIPKHSKIDFTNKVEKLEYSIFNMDKKSYKGPNYKGIYLNKIVDRKLSFVNDESYIEFIKSILHELAIKAFVYYHGFFQHPENCIDKICCHDVSSKDFFSSISIQDDDCQIVQHLCQVVLKQQLFLEPK